MIREFESIQVAAFPVETIGKCGQITTSAVVNHVLKDLLYTKAQERCGYFLSVTELISIGKAKLLSSSPPSSSFVVVPVKFCFRSFLPTAGETMVGAVTRVIRNGVFLSFGPMNSIYLHRSKMPGYSYVDSEQPCFQRDDLSRIEKDVVVCFKVLAVRWSDGDMCKRDFQILATVDGDSLGPVSLAGDGLDFPCSYLL